MRQFVRLAVVLALVVFGATDALAATASKVVAGHNHTCALTTTGGVECWGYNNYYQLGDGTNVPRSTPAPVGGLTSGVTDIVAGNSHTCALVSGGVVCWGGNSDGQLGDGTYYNQPTPVAVVGLGSGVASIATGLLHTCAVKTNGTTVCWGDNTAGQLGDGTTTGSSTPVTVSGLSATPMALVAGAAHTCARIPGHNAQCWGYNAFGQLGNGTTVDKLTPTAVTGIAGTIESLAAGANHTCAVVTGGAVACWGDGTYGQLGDGTTDSQSTPVAVTGFSGTAAVVVAGSAHTCARTTGGGVQCWGYNFSGELGDGTTTDRWTPTQVTGLSSGVTSIGSGSDHVCAVKTGGNVTCWGDNGFGALGDASSVEQLAPRALSGLSSGTASIDGGYAHTCARTTTGGVECWGYNYFGQIGDGTTNRAVTPTGVYGLSSGVAALSVGDRHACALMSGTGLVSCWGNGSSGELGDGLGMRSFTPVQVAGLASVKAISAGGFHNCAITSSNGVACWGLNNLGQLGDGTTTMSLTPVAVTGLPGTVVAISAGTYHTCAVTGTGAAYCWGNDWKGQLGDALTGTHSVTPVAVSGLTSGVTAISAGGEHTCALTASGVVCWGANNAGQLGDNTLIDESTPVAVVGLSATLASIAAGSGHTCARTTAGAALCWGANAYGQVGDGGMTDRITPTAVIGLSSGVSSVNVGSNQSCAVVTGGAAVCWGSDTGGQLGLGRRVDGVTPLAVYGYGGAIGVTGIDPAAGPAAGATLVTITGSYFVTGATVTFGGTSASYVSVVNPWTIQAVTPAHAAAIVSVVVTNPDTTQATLTNAFTYTGTGTTRTRGDFNGDLKADLLWRGTSGGDMWLWTMNGLTPATQSYVSTVGTAYAVLATGDFNNDTRTDLLWRGTSGGDVWLWTMNGSTISTETFVSTVATSYSVIASGDFDGDGKADILWRGTGGASWMWLMNGATVKSSTYMGTISSTYTVRGVGDLDNDGKADIVLQGTGGDLWGWLMNGAALKSSGYLGTVSPSSFQVQQTADFDGDGKADLLWRGTAAGDMWLWKMNGTTVSSSTYVGTISTSYTIIAGGDYDNDTKSDLLWRGTGGDLWVWLMNGAATKSSGYAGTVSPSGYSIVNK